MSFYSPMSNMTIDGSDENSNLKEFDLIPDGTQVPVVIQDAVFTPAVGEYEQRYDVTYQIAEGEYKKQVVRQKIKCFDLDPIKRDRAVNQLMRLFKLCETKPTHTNAPANEDLAPLKGKVIGINIGQWDFNGKQGNFVRGTYAIDDKFETKTGRFIEPKTTTPAPTTQGTVNLDDDIPF